MLYSNRYKMIAHFENVQALPEYQLVEMMGRMADCDMLLMQTRPYEVSYCSINTLLQHQSLISVTVIAIQQQPEGTNVQLPVEL
jgi:hypothetical protein